jgi:hypothetical protein
MQMKMLLDLRRHALITCGFTPFWDNLPQSGARRIVALYTHAALCDDRMADMFPLTLCGRTENRILSIVVLSRVARRHPPR